MIQIGEGDASFITNDQKANGEEVRKMSNLETIMWISKLLRMEFGWESGKTYRA
jgi:hypothetical protein